MADTKPLLSNPVLDNLYSIRRILVGQYTFFSSVAGREYEQGYYREKVNAMDSAIAAFIEVNNVPIEHTERTVPLDRLRIPLGTFEQPNKE